MSDGYKIAPCSRCGSEIHMIGSNPATFACSNKNCPDSTEPKYKICPKCLRHYVTSHGCFNTESEYPNIFSDNMIKPDEI